MKQFLLKGIYVMLILMLTACGGGGGGDNDDDDDVVVEAPQDIKSVVTIDETTQAILGTEITNIYTNISEESYSGDSAEIDISTVDEFTPNLVISENSSGNPVLLSVNYRGENSTELSISSTAKAMVLYDPFLMRLEDSDYALAKQYVESSSEMAELETLIQNAIANDPVDPLFNSQSDVIYEKAVKIAKKIRDQISASKKILVKREDSGENEDYENLLISDDDKKNGDVTLVNKTACIYNAKIKTGDTLNSQFGSTYFLNRVPLFDYQIISFDTNGITFDPKIIDEQSSRIPGVGDQYFGVEFEKQKTTTYYVLAVQVILDVIGIGVDNISGEDAKVVADLFAKHFSAVVNIINKNIVEKPNNIEEASKQAYDMIKEAANLGFDPVISFVKELAQEAAFKNLEKRLSEKYTAVVLKMIYKKAVLWATLGYNAADTAYVIWDIHYAPDTYEKLAIQNQGVCPGEAVYAESSRTNITDTFWGGNSVNMNYYCEIKAPGAKKIREGLDEDGWPEFVFDYKPIKGYEVELNFQVNGDAENSSWTYNYGSGYEVYTITNKYYEYYYLKTNGKIKSTTVLENFSFSDSEITSTVSQERNTYKIEYDYNYPIAAASAGIVFEYSVETYTLDDEGNFVLTNTYNSDSYFDVFVTYHQWAKEIYLSMDEENIKDVFKKEISKKHKNVKMR